MQMMRLRACSSGMSWSGYRPSDDPQVYGYNVPVNMYAAGALARAKQLNSRIWHSASLVAPIARLAEDIRRGLAAWAVVKTEDGTRVYAYEVSLQNASKFVEYMQGVSRHGMPLF